MKALKFISDLQGKKMISLVASTTSQKKIESGYLALVWL